VWGGGEAWRIGSASRCVTRDEVSEGWFVWQLRAWLRRVLCDAGNAQTVSVRSASSSPFHCRTFAPGLIVDHHAFLRLPIGTFTWPSIILTCRNYSYGVYESKCESLILHTRSVKVSPCFRPSITPETGYLRENSRFHSFTHSKGAIWLPSGLRQAP
jgi:hypothetical protein